MKSKNTNMKVQKKPKKQAKLNTPASSPTKYLALSFVFPFVILGTVFALHKVYPFGNRQILNYDFYNQFYPFLSGFWQKLRTGTVSPWSWAAGAGHDFTALIAYYLASPLNLLTALAPHVWLREMVTLALMVKIGCAGLFTAMCLRYAYKQYGLALPVFSSLYALCAFTLGYYHNVIWFDTFALLPLVMLGLLALMREGKYRLYIVSLALAVLTNFYMGYMVCVFVAMAFFSLCVIQKLNLRDFLRKLGHIAASSALAVGLTAVLTIPAWFALQDVYRTPATPPTLSLFYNSFFAILGNFIAFTPPTFMEGLPNLYTGMISVLLVGIFIVSPKVSLREKITLAGIFVFLVISCNLDTLYLMMHAFRYPVGYPARFSYLLSFVLVVMAYRAFIIEENIEGGDRRGLLAIVISAALFLFSAALGPQKKNYIIGSAVLCASYVVLLYFLMKAKTVKARTIVKAVFFLAVLTELSITTYIGVKTVGTTDRAGYYDGYEQIQVLLNKRKKTSNDFYRTDTAQSYNSNEAYLYNYNGLSFFSSTISPDLLRFMQGLGLLSNRSIYNSFRYNITTPLADALLNMRYMINRRDGAMDKNFYWKVVGEIGNFQLVENKYYLPLGFMVNEEIVGYKGHDNPFLSQNNFFRLATGLNGSLFAISDISTMVVTDNALNISTWNYRAPVAGMAYVYCLIKDETKKRSALGVYLNDETEPSLYYVHSNTPFLFTVGNLAEGDRLSFLLETDKATMYVLHLNSELFERGYAKLAAQTLHLTKFTNTKVRGNVTALEDGLLYTSIPADKNWRVYVDGEKSGIVPIDGAMAAVRLNKGYHEIEFRYFNTSLLVGIIVSLVSLALFVAESAWTKRRSTNVPNRKLKKNP